MADQYVFSSAAGRRPRRTSKMPRSSFTADVEELLFLRIFSGRDATVSRGIQLAVRRMIETDESASRYMRFAKRMLGMAEGELQEQGVLPTQVALWEHVTEHHDRILGQLQATDTAVDAVA